MTPAIRKARVLVARAVELDPGAAVLPFRGGLPHDEALRRRADLCLEYATRTLRQSNEALLRGESLR